MTKEELAALKIDCIYCIKDFGLNIHCQKVNSYCGWPHGASKTTCIRCQKLGEDKQGNMMLCPALKKLADGAMSARLRASVQDPKYPYDEHEVLLAHHARVDDESFKATFKAMSEEQLATTTNKLETANKLLAYGEEFNVTNVLQEIVDNGE